MSLWNQSGSRRKNLALLALVCAAVIVVITTLVGLTVAALSDDQDTAPTSTTADPPPSESAASDTEGVVTLPEASTQVDGLPVGFPRSEPGAAAAAVEYARTQVGFDYDQAAAAAEVYATPGEETGIVEAARQAVAYRRQNLGAPGAGQVPAPAAFALTPFAYRTVELGTDFFAVTVLNVATTTTVKGETEQTLYAGTQLLRWAGEDWKVTRGSATDLEQLRALPPAPAVLPEDPQFAQAGWIQFEVLR